MISATPHSSAVDDGFVTAALHCRDNDHRSRDNHHHQHRRPSYDRRSCKRTSASRHEEDNLFLFCKNNKNSGDRNVDLLNPPKSQCLSSVGLAVVNNNYDNNNISSGGGGSSSNASTSLLDCSSLERSLKRVRLTCSPGEICLQVRKFVFSFSS